MLQNLEIVSAQLSASQILLAVSVFNNSSRAKEPVYKSLFYSFIYFLTNLLKFLHRYLRSIQNLSGERLCSIVVYRQWRTCCEVLELYEKTNSACCGTSNVRILRIHGEVKISFFHSAN